MKPLIELMTEEDEAYRSVALSRDISIHENQQEIWNRILDLNPDKDYLRGDNSHPSWIACKCNGSEFIREEAKEFEMDEDSPNNVLTHEEHLELFNKCSILYSGCPTEDILRKRRLMNKAVAIIRTHAQAITVNVNERRKTAARAEKELIAAEDKKYVPKLRPDEKASEEEVKLMKLINEDEKLQRLLKHLPTPQYKAVLGLIKQLGIDSAKKMMWPNEYPSEE